MKETILKFPYGNEKIIVGRKVRYNGIEYHIVGFDNDYTVFACLNPKNIEQARVLSLTKSEIEEFIEEGSLLGYEGGLK